MWLRFFPLFLTTFKNRRNKFTYAEFTILTKMRKQFDILFPFSKSLKKFTTDSTVLLSKFTDFYDEINKFYITLNFYLIDLSKLVYFFDDQVNIYNSSCTKIIIIQF